MGLQDIIGILAGCHENSTAIKLEIIKMDDENWLRKNTLIFACLQSPSRDLILEHMRMQVRMQKRDMIFSFLIARMKKTGVNVRDFCMEQYVTTSKTPKKDLRRGENKNELRNKTNQKRTGQTSNELLTLL